MTPEALRKRGYTKKSRTHEILDCSYVYLRKPTHQLCCGWEESRYPL